MKKWHLPIVTGIISSAVLVGSLLYFYKDNINIKEESLNTTKNSDSLFSNNLSYDNTIKIASFNIQVFGKSKLEKKEVMDVLVNIVKNYDIIAIQELRDNTDTTLSYFIDRINKSVDDNLEVKFDYIGSRGLGRTRVKERYAFIYNTNIINYSNSYIYNDEHDKFEREPFIAGFHSGNFDFALVNVHIKPDDANREIASLEEVVKNAQLIMNERDIIVLGDFNADGNYFSESINYGFRDSRYKWIIRDDVDTTLALGSNTYDRIVFLPEYTNEDYADKYGVFLFDVEYNLSKEFAKKVSDHYPVWGLFYTNKDSD